MAKKRRFRALIAVEGGTVMLLSRAKDKVKKGLAMIVNGRVRFLDPTAAGYSAAKGYTRWGGAKSGPYGPTVMQASRENKGRRLT